ncbi:MAG: 4Fe-4S binding protein [Planctomycetes bacterium]|nr:4Fe-4S binding protein [Planctomycetota bacterium]
MQRLNKTCCAGLVAVLAMLYALPAESLERFPPPDFESGFVFPEVTKPGPRPQLLEYLDVSVLIGALSLAAYLGIRKRSRTGLAVLGVFSLAYFGLWRRGCICPVGAIQNVALSLSDGGYVLPLSVAAFFFLPLFFALLFGRVFCSSVCPLGAIQDVVVLKPLRLPMWLEHSLGVLPYLYLGTAVVVTMATGRFMICRLDPYVGFFRLSGRLAMLITGGILLVAGVFVGRIYCRFICPYGAILRIFSIVSKWHVRIGPRDCVACTLCEDACPYNAILKPSGESAPGGIAGRALLARLIILLPLLMLAGYIHGKRLGPVLSKMHPRVRLAEQLWVEEERNARVRSDQTLAFIEQGGVPKELFGEALLLKSKNESWGRLLGLWAGAVTGLKLISLSLRRRREGYTPDRAKCVSCGRCFSSCPQHRAERRGLLPVERSVPDGS